MPGIGPGPVHSFVDDDSDYRGGFRTDFTQAGGDKRFLTVISADGDVASATATGADGVTISLAGGGTATVTFQHDGVGATYTPAGGSAISLGAGVQTLPE